MRYQRKNYTPFQYTPQSYQPSQALPYGQNQFDPPDYEQMFRPEPPPPTAPQPQQEQPSFNFPQEYEKILGQNPKRLAYQQALESGPEYINRGKWAKLGAGLAAAGTYLGSGDPVAGAKLGTSVYQAPNERRRDQWKDKVAGLGQSAQFEQADMANKIKALEAHRADYYDQQRAEREREQLQIQRDAEARAKLESTERIEGSKQEREKAQWMRVDDPTDGMAKLVNWRNPSEVKILGRTSETPKEESDREIADLKEKEKVLEVGRKAGDNRRAASTREVANIGAESGENVASTNKDAKIQAIRAKNDQVAKALKPGEVSQQVWVDLEREFSSDPVLREIDLEDYVDISVGPDGNHVIKPKAGGSFGGLVKDSLATQAIKQKIANIIAQSIAKSQGGGAGGKKDSLGLRDK